MLLSYEGRSSHRVRGAQVDVIWRSLIQYLDLISNHFISHQFYRLDDLWVINLGSPGVINLGPSRQ
jgi:hypothetical protein